MCQPGLDRRKNMYSVVLVTVVIMQDNYCNAASI